MTTYRQTIAVNSNNETLHVLNQLLLPGDNVIEIGTNLGVVTTTARDLIKPGKIVGFDFDRKFTKRDELKHFRRTNELEGVEFHKLTETHGRFRNGTAKSPFSVATLVLQTLLKQPTNLRYRVIILDLSNIYGNDLYADFVVAMDIFRSIFSAFHMEYMIVKSHFMKTIARKYMNTAQLIDRTCQTKGTKCNIYFKQYQDELANSILTNNVGYIDCGPIVLGARGVHEYRKASLLCVEPGDSVLEIGCHCGKTTKLLKDQGANVVGVDIGKSIVKEAIKRYPDVRFHVGKWWLVVVVVSGCCFLMAMFLTFCCSFCIWVLFQPMLGTSIL
jgi:protein-L-isoaspartate O-methyltransferase